jgi:hypothetical protein
MFGLFADIWEISLRSFTREMARSQCYGSIVFRPYSFTTQEWKQTHTQAYLIM